LIGTNDNHCGLPKHWAFDSVEALNASMRNLLDNGGEADFDEVFDTTRIIAASKRIGEGKGIPSEFVTALQDLYGTWACTPQSLAILQGYARRLREFGFIE
jgi:hypothetical protein